LGGFAYIMKVLFPVEGGFDSECSLAIVNYLVMSSKLGLLMIAHRTATA
jgi:hypothetical protein